MDEVNYEEKAISQGWVEQSEWKGDPEKWRPAKEFVERGENIIPILRDKVKKLEDELKMSVKVNQAEIEELKKATYAQAKKDFDAEVERIRKEKFEAVQSGDVEQFTKLEKAEKAIKEPKEPEKTKQVVTPVFEDWKSKNDWYSTDPELTDYAEFVAAKINKEKPGLPEAEFYKTVETKVKTAFREKFTNPNREKEDLVGSGGAKPNANKKGWGDLPDTAKSAYTRLAKKFEMNGRKLDKDTYVKEYFEA